MENTVEKALAVAVELAEDAGRMLMEHLAGGLEMELKGEINPVTELDRRVEEFLVGSIRERFPEHDFMAEEQTASRGGTEYRWVIDPIDGTTNYAHGYPCFTVSIGLERAGETLLGVIHQPATGEMFTAVNGEGARLGERKLAVSGRADGLGEAFLVTGFPYNLREDGVLERNVRRFERLLGASFAVRRDGSAAYDLACVSAGRFDGYWEENLNPWDTIAGSLMVREAGGIVTDFRGRPFDPHRSDTVLAACNRAIHKQMIDKLAEE